ncbi:hypothetical protein C2G38_2032853 [Gigaspora rosea]|uniref:Uncharacterized protein n=1 Tax=Gigaspora rosea TaxID=44941 RepID=A0A397VLH3_9GLOM|nr:hypothetical protein C2G38_2032853 [Gigaspora rosea]CAG8598927.1 22852_t:CDS:2 [Gigaspora rosea]
MSNDVNAERLPLLEPWEDPNPINYKEQCICCWFSIAIIVVLFIAVITSSGISYPNLPTGVSEIPQEYRFRYKDILEYNYIIEGYPTEFNGGTDNQPEFIKYAEIEVVRNWTDRNINVIEFRHYPNDTVFSVSTVTSQIESHEADILFTAANDADLGLESCEYRINWAWYFSGYIRRRCENNNETDFKKVSIFRGHPAWGLTFLSVDEKINYGYSTRADFWDLFVRNIFVDQAAPFPPIIPAIYIACYNYLGRIENK